MLLLIYISYKHHYLFIDTSILFFKIFQLYNSGFIFTLVATVTIEVHILVSYRLY